jgi:hypothetical protein
MDSMECQYCYAVTSQKISDGTILKQDIKEGEIIGEQGPQGPPGEVLDDSVTTAKIQDGQVMTADLSDNVVTTPNIQDDSVTDAKVSFIKWHELGDGENGWNPDGAVGDFVITGVTDVKRDSVISISLGDAASQVVFCGVDDKGTGTFTLHCSGPVANGAVLDLTVFNPS